MNLKTIIGIALLAVFGFLVVNSFGQQVAGYENFGEASQNARRAHVVGTWERAQPMAYDPSTNRFSFYMRDEMGVVRQVVYANPKPANFEDAERVVVDGQMEGDVFVAEHILVKCPSKYNDARGLEGTPTTPASNPATSG
ncbi:MAG TPA: cytochrome c maturation protein CcmE [Rubricoccaceae bacterium]|nr:cytochrome c maturation protein CcmE [Rubricoccaceae bacterium]